MTTKTTKTIDKKAIYWILHRKTADADNRSDEGTKFVFQDDKFVASQEIEPDTELHVADEYANVTSGLYKLDKETHITCSTMYLRDPNETNESLKKEATNKIPLDFWERFSEIEWDDPVDGELHVAMHRLRHIQEIHRTNPLRAPGPGRPEWIERYLHQILDGSAGWIML